MTLASEPFDICALLRDTSRMICARGDVVVIQRSLDADGRELAGLRVKGDAVRLRQIVLNLLSNACKHTSEGAIEVILAVAAPREPAHASFNLQVRDTGAGIDSAQQQDVFSKYVTADGAKDSPSSWVASSTKSTGLGLVVAKRLVQLRRRFIYLSVKPCDFGS